MRCGMGLIDRPEVARRLGTSGPEQYSGLVAHISSTAPTIEAEPITQGTWIEYDNSHCECPSCHSEWSYFDNETERFDYCPNCGERLVDGKESV